MTPSRTRAPVWRWTTRIRCPRRLGQDWSALPVVATLGGRKVRWAGPLVDANRALLLSDKSEQTAFDPDWGVACWPTASFAQPDGGVSPAWAEALLQAAETLSVRHRTPAEEWLSWLCFSLSGPHRVLKQRWEERRAC